MCCKDCPYHWKSEDEKYAMCHWESKCPGDLPPCEYEEQE